MRDIGRQARLLLRRKARRAAAGRAAAAAARRIGQQIHKVRHQLERAGLRAGRRLAGELRERVAQRGAGEIAEIEKARRNAVALEDRIVDAVEHILLVLVQAGRRREQRIAAGRNVEIDVVRTVGRVVERHRAAEAAAHGQAGEGAGERARRGQNLIIRPGGVAAELRRHLDGAVAAERGRAGQRHLGIIAGAGRDIDGVEAAACERQSAGDVEGAVCRRAGLVPACRRN